MNYNEQNPMLIGAIQSSKRIQAGYDMKPSTEKDAIRRKAERLGASFLDDGDFRKGHTVCWKAGLQNNISIPYGYPMIVLDIDHSHRGIDGERGDTVEIGVLKFIESEHVEIFDVFWVDGRRLMLYP